MKQQSTKNSRVSALEKLRLRSESVTDEHLKQIQESLWQEIQSSDFVDTDATDLDSFLHQIQKRLQNIDYIDGFPESVAKAFRVKNWKELDYLKGYSEEELRSKSFIKGNLKLYELIHFFRTLLLNLVVSGHTSSLLGESEKITKALTNDGPLSSTFYSESDFQILGFSKDDYHHLLKPLLFEANSIFESYRKHIKTNGSDYKFPNYYRKVKDLQSTKDWKFEEIFDELYRKVKGIPKGFDLFYDLESDSFKVISDSLENKTARKASNFVKLGDLATYQTSTGLNGLAQFLVKDESLATYKEKLRKIAESGLKRKYTSVLKNPPTFESVLRGSTSLLLVSDEEVLDYLSLRRDYNSYIELAKQGPNLEQQQRLIDLLGEAIKRND